MSISVRVSGDFGRIMLDHVAEAEGAITRGVRSVASGLKTSWRGQITGSGLGRRLANTVRQQDYPKGDVSMRAASLVYARPNAKRGQASAATVVDAFDQGVTIRSTSGLFLAIPLPAAGKVAGGGGRRSRRLTPERWEQRTGLKLRLVYRRGKTSLLVADDARLNSKNFAARKGGRRRKDGMLTGAATVPIFVLVPQATLRKRLNLDAAVEAARAQLPGAILSRWK